MHLSQILFVYIFVLFKIGIGIKSEKWDVFVLANLQRLNDDIHQTFLFDRHLW